MRFRSLASILLLLVAVTCALAQVTPSGRFVDRQGGTNAGSGGPVDEALPFDGHATLGTNLVDYYKLDETSGNRLSSVTGSSPFAENGSLSYDVGKSGNALKVSSVFSGYLERSTSMVNGDASFSVWVYTNGAGTASYWFQQFASPFTPRLQVSIVAASQTMNCALYDDTGAVVQVQTAAMSSSAWHHVVLVVDTTARTCSMYLDNAAPVTTAALANPVRTGSDTFRVGRFAVSTGNLWDEWAIWSKMLTAGEVSVLYNSGAGKFY